jgi:cytochrome b subunit of formate dehydrogenase
MAHGGAARGENAGKGMSPVWLRRALHAVHVVTSLVLLASGLLLEFPDLRARVVGGYGREIARVHNWLGLAFVVAPALALAIAPRLLVRDLRLNLSLPAGLTWPGLHMLLTLVFSLLLAVSGVFLWVDWDLPLTALDAMLEVHIVVTWLLVASILAHLFAARRAIAARVGLFGRETDRETRNA